MGSGIKSMASQGKHSIIHRKAEGGRLDFDARVMTPAKALRLALAKTADRLFDLVLTVTTVEQITLAHGKMRDVAGNDGLLIVLDGAGGACGAAKFDTQILAGLIEVQTTGVVKPVEVEPRPVTVTDAAMVAPAVNAMMQGFDAELNEAWPGHQAQGFRFGDMIEDGRALALLLDAPEYDLFRLTVDLAEGAKTGVLTLILPVQPQIDEAAQRQRAQADNSTGFKGNALEAPVTMDVIVARVRMPLNEVCQLKMGSILPVPAEALSKTELVAAGNHVVSEVLLGQMNGFKAVRFAPSEAAQLPDASEPVIHVSKGGDPAGSGGEVLEGHVIEPGAAGKTDAGAAQAGMRPDVRTMVKTATDQALSQSDALVPGLSELDALPEKV